MRSNQATNNLYANYNALQVTWARQKGRYVIQANYSYQKVDGDRQPAADNPLQPRSEFGVQPADRRQLFNVSYSVELGSPLKRNGIVKVRPGWQVSGISTVESGANLTYNGGTTPIRLQHAVEWPIIPGSISAANPAGIPINNQSILGTNAIQLNPIVTCNPMANLAAHQYVNATCFAAPTEGRAKWSDAAARRLRTGLLQLGSRAV